MSETSENGTEAAGDEGKTEARFTQADVDRLVAKARGEERRKAGEKFGDYDDLKAKAGESTTLEERVRTIEQQARDAEQRALRAEVAIAKGLTPGQAKRLVGSTAEELTADAEQLLADIGEQRSTGNHVPSEGNNPQPGGDDMREFTRTLFARAAGE